MAATIQELPDTAIPSWLQAGLDARVHVVGGLALLRLGAWDVHADAIARGFLHGKPRVPEASVPAA